MALISEWNTMPDKPEPFKFLMLPPRLKILDMDFANLYAHRMVVNGFYGKTGDLNITYNARQETSMEEIIVTINLDSL